MKKYDMIDLHAHPSLKLYYFPYLLKSFKIKTFSGPIFNPLGMRTRYDNINNSNIKIIINAHYVIEKDFIKKGFKKVLKYSLWGIAPLIINKILKEDPYQSLLNQFKLLEESIIKSNKKTKKGGKTLKIIHNYLEINKLKENEVGIIHAVEGSHAFGYKPENHETLDDFFNKIKERVIYLKMKGLFMVGVSHFWDNMYLPQTDGTEIIRKKEKGKIISKRNDSLFQMKRANWKFGDKNKLSKQFISLLLDNNIIIDIVHTQEDSRKQVYEICKEYNKPIVASHIGIKHFFEHEYNLSDEELLKIHELKGVIGLIFSKRWLISPQNRKNNKGGIKDLIQNIKYIKKLTGDVSIISFGTDFDGFTTPFTDLYTYSQNHKLLKALKEEFTEKEIKDILHNNILRVLKTLK